MAEPGAALGLGRPVPESADMSRRALPPGALTQGGVHPRSSHQASPKTGGCRPHVWSRCVFAPQCAQPACAAPHLFRPPDLGGAGPDRLGPTPWADVTGGGIAEAHRLDGARPGGAVDRFAGAHRLVPGPLPVHAAHWVDSPAGADLLLPAWRAPVRPQPGARAGGAVELRGFWAAVGGGSVDEAWAALERAAAGWHRGGGGGHPGWGGVAAPRRCSRCAARGGARCFGDNLGVNSIWYSERVGGGVAQEGLKSSARVARIPPRHRR